LLLGHKETKHSAAWKESTQYVGCYIDNMEDRALHISLYEENMDENHCIGYCMLEGIFYCFAMNTI